MKTVFVGQEDFIIGLSNAAKQPVVHENLFDYFAREKPQLAITSETGFDRSLFKNVLKHKCEIVVIGKEYPEKKFEQLASRGASPVFLKEEDIVAFDPVRYTIGGEIENSDKICLISNSPFIEEIYYSKGFTEETDVYTKQKIYLPNYKGWPNDKEFYKLKKYKYVYDYDDSLDETHLLYTLIGLDCNYNGQRDYSLKENAECKTYSDSLNFILERIK